MMAPKNMAIIGSSAGGGLTLAMVLRAKRDNLPLPGAIAPGTPMSDLTQRRRFLLDQCDGRQRARSRYTASCDARAALYANGHDLKDPLLSPVYGDMRGFPPTILNTGTRDLLLSSTVRVHRKLRQAGVEALCCTSMKARRTADGIATAQRPKSREAFEEIARFFDKHLGK